VLLPGPEESQGRARRFRLLPRLTSHVRHQTKYLDMPVADGQAFVFTSGSERGPRARTLKEFVALLRALPPDRLAGHLQRHDFSHWVHDVFRDHPLAERIDALESQEDPRDDAQIAEAIGQIIRARYDTAGGEESSRHAPLAASAK
jgi:hypothetical protein